MTTISATQVLIGIAQAFEQAAVMAERRKREAFENLDLTGYQLQRANQQLLGDLAYCFGKVAVRDAEVTLSEPPDDPDGLPSEKPEPEDQVPISRTPKTTKREPGEPEWRQPATKGRKE